MIVLFTLLTLLLVAKTINTLCMMREEDEDGADETAPRCTRKDTHIKYEYPAQQDNTHTEPTEEVTDVAHNPRDKLIRNYKREYKEWKRSLEQYERIRGHFI